MPPTLTDEQLLHPEVPDAWEPILERLARFELLLNELGRDAEPDEAQPLVELHEALFEDARALLEVDAGPEISLRAWNRVFATALVMLTRLEFATMFGKSVLDTYGSKTLKHFQVDWAGDEAASERLMDYARERLRVPEAELAEIHREVEARLEDARRKGAVVDAIVKLFELREDAPDLRLNIRRLVHFLYPECELEADEMELIVVGTAIFVCLPFDKEDLETNRFKRMSDEEQQPVRDFLRKVNQFRPQHFQNFPVFGYLDGKDLDKDWVSELGQEAGLSPEQVRTEISRMVAILPMNAVDKFVVHDVWGHVWQAAMLDFEEMYQELGKYSDHLDWYEQANSQHGSGLRLCDCFDGQGHGFMLHRESFERFLYGEVVERIPVSYSAIVAEMFADVVEYKFLEQHPERREDMPSSSYFKDMPTKLDLLIEDLDLYFQQSVQAFDKSLIEEHGREALRAQMIAAGASEAAAEQALADMAQVWSEAQERTLADVIKWWRTDDGELHCNVYGRLALSFLSLHRSVTTVSRALHELDLSGTPLRMLYDLMLLAVSVYFETDRARTLWRLDEFLEDGFVDQCDALVAFLKRPPQTP